MIFRVISCFILYFMTAGTSFAADCPSLPSQPQPSEADLNYQRAWKGVAVPYSVDDWMGGYDFAPLGVGHLRVKDVDDHYYDWQRKLFLPLWQSPGKAFYGWIHSGLVSPVNDVLAYALTGAGMVETGYEHMSLTVLKSFPDGWLQLQLAPGKDGSKWTHQCYLQLGEAKLEYQTWEAFIVENGEWLHFRTSKNHLLRSEPDPEAKIITRIGADHELRLLAIKDDWMRVSVRQPDWTCAGSDEDFKGRKDVGWVKWKDELLGPWVWIYSRGC